MRCGTGERDRSGPRAVARRSGRRRARAAKQGEEDRAAGRAPRGPRPRSTRAREGDAGAAARGGVGANPHAGGRAAPDEHRGRVLRADRGQVG